MRGAPLPDSARAGLVAKAVINVANTAAGHAYDFATPHNEAAFRPAFDAAAVTPIARGLQWRAWIGALFLARLGPVVPRLLLHAGTMVHRAAAHLPGGGARSTGRDRARCGHTRRILARSPGHARMDSCLVASSQSADQASDGSCQTSRSAPHASRGNTSLLLLPAAMKVLRSLLVPMMTLALVNCADGTLQPSRSPDDPSNPRAPEAPVLAPPAFGSVTAIASARAEPMPSATPSAMPGHHHHQP
jgi:hypothetical protein